MWTDDEMAEHLQECIAADETSPLAGEVEISTYAEAGVMTTNAGLVLRRMDGSEYQITVVRSR